MNQRKATVPTNDPDIALVLIHYCRRMLAQPGLDPDLRKFWQKNLEFNLASLAKPSGDTA